MLALLLPAFVVFVARSPAPLFVRPPAQLLQRQALTLRRVGESGGEPKFYETKKVNWSDDDYIILPYLDETEDNATKGAGVLAFIVGALLPIFGGFWTGVIFAFLGSYAKSGELGRYQRQSEFGKQFANFSDEAGDLLGQGGMSLVKAYNWGATKLANIRIK
eukprot:TRINITY_DN108624_c0_g1_i1.p1 TRINITY_DN108624_c0_g1~~TRINITY_DN108624_c0_g1_i1.p1  ORF type:complete len:162 (+),score=38.48 TRINITY_DN108624_c0_g1_i1:30-515(+)